MGRPAPSFTMEFRKASWDDVFEWYAKMSGLTFLSAVKPTGTASSILIAAGSASRTAA